MNWQGALNERVLTGKRITVGFDGFVDTIVKPLRHAAAAGTPAVPFGTIREFGEFLIGKAEKSCSIELEPVARRLGGNLPYLSCAAGRLGADVSCLGMLGQPGRPDPVFAKMPCKLYPFAPPGQSTCLEFGDGKILLAADCAFSEDVWRLVDAAAGGRAEELLTSPDLLALVNWSELSFAHGLWERTLEAVRSYPPDRERYAFFDLCDVSRKAVEELEAVLRLMGRFSDCRKTVLSLNENEARVIAEQLFPNVQALPGIAEKLCAGYGMDEVIIHTIRETYLLTGRGLARRHSDFVPAPKISTGAGDNFNGAFCFATVQGLGDEDRIAFANAAARFYITHGRAASLAELVE